ncbi:hypothetical protein [Demequina sp.]|uniref:hypothetical protein n=1 Tax=Demequina sp. TaxID=2050685 RepID=UPI0025E69880|nr:hypothetical protein [Demequina sp.]
MTRRLSTDGVMRVGAAVLVGLVVVLYVVGAVPAPVAFALGAVAVLGLAVWEGVLGFRHRNEAARFALEHGWEHLPRTAAYSTRFGGYPFDLGGRAYQTDVLRGTYAGWRCATFTHVVEQDVGAGDNKSETRQTFQVTLAELPVNLPRLDIVPESLATRAAQALGAVDIDVESHAFNERWRVITRDRRYGHDVIDPRMIARLLEHDVEGRAVRIDGGAVMVWGVGREGVSTLSSRLGVVTGIARRIPRHVLRRLEEQGRAMRDPDAPLVGPEWAITPGALTSGRYTGIGAEEYEAETHGPGVAGDADPDEGRV